MGFDRYFTLGLVLRLVLVLLALSGLAWSLLTPDLSAVRIVSLLLVVGSVWTLWQHVQRTNREISRFIEAFRFGDMQARFSRPDADSGFDALGEALDRSMRALQAERAQLSEAGRFYEALVDDVPVAMLTVDADGAVSLVNKAARRLFNLHAGIRAADFAPYGHALVDAIESLEPGRTLTTILSLDVGPQRAIVRAGELTRTGAQTRVLAVQVIQQSLNAIEVAAQSDLIRVLTHEIMNSLTPVTSLARTAAELVAEADTGADPVIADARQAVETLSRRADGVMHFVESYREITRPPQIARKRVPAGPFAAELAQLFKADIKWDDVVLAIEVLPETHVIDADPDLLAQVVINLLRNAAEAAAAHTDTPRVALRIAALRSGRTQISVTDNGPGVPEALRKDIFLPFHTTRKSGTGVGLSFARQVVLAHEGTIDVTAAPGGGALFSVVV